MENIAKKTKYVWEIIVKLKKNILKKWKLVKVNKQNNKIK